jgi:acyl carrier protein
VGLDTVELVLEIEDAFSIKIPDDEANAMVTVGDVFDYIVAKTSVPTNSSVCLSAIAFYALRRAATTLGATNRLRPSDPILAILPDSHRPEYWAQLQDTSKLRLPPLRRANWLVTICTLGVIACSAILGVFAYRSTDSPLAGFVSVVTAGIAVGLIAGWITRPFAIYPANNCTTLRGLAESALGLNFKALSDRYNGASKNDLWVALRSIIVEQLGVSPEEVMPTASFVKDLGCG